MIFEISILNIIFLLSAVYCKNDIKMNFKVIIIYQLTFFRKNIKNQFFQFCYSKTRVEKSWTKLFQFWIYFQFKAVLDIQEHVEYRQSHQDLIFPWIQQSYEAGLQIDISNFLNSLLKFINWNCCWSKANTSFHYFMTVTRKIDWMKFYMTNQKICY